MRKALLFFSIFILFQLELCAQNYYLLESDTIVFLRNNSPNDTIGQSHIFKGDTINRVDERGFKQGWWIQIDNAGFKLFGVFVNDKKHGYFRNFHPNGVLESGIKYVNDSAVGFSSSFHSNGKLNQSGFWLNNPPASARVHINCFAPFACITYLLMLILRQCSRAVTGNQSSNPHSPNSLTHIIFHSMFYQVLYYVIKGHDDDNASEKYLQKF
jgi:hypothetical protein